MSENWQKATRTSNLGTPRLTYLVVNREDEGDWDDGEGSHTESNSDFAKSILLLQARGVDFYDIGQVVGSRYTVAASANTCPLGEGESIGDGSKNQFLSDYLSEELGFSVEVWNARLRSDDISYD
jgi:hypothetical protein